MTGITCSGCGAKYSRLPAYTCPRCGTPLCSTGCEGCGAQCSPKLKQNGGKRSSERK